MHECSTRACESLERSFSLVKIRPSSPSCEFAERDEIGDVLDLRLHSSVVASCTLEEVKR